MNSRRFRFAFVTAVLTTAVVCFTLGVMHARRIDAADRAPYDSRLEALRVELQEALARDRRGTSGSVGTGGSSLAGTEPSDAPDRARLVAEIKEQLRAEMGLLPVSLLRERRSSFVELYAYDRRGEKSYGTAGYLGHGYFVTVKHAVVTLGNRDDRDAAERAIEKVAILYKGREVPARVVDVGKAANEVDPGDWAILKTRDLGLPALNVDTAFPFEFADSIVRFGNDYSKGIIVSSAYVGQRTDAGLVTSLSDGHPGVSGGGVLDQRGVLVGIPIGRMHGDYRFSFILPMRQEMLRKVPGVQIVARQ